MRFQRPAEIERYRQYLIPKRDQLVVLTRMEQTLHARADRNLLSPFHSSAPASRAHANTSICVG